MENTCPFLKEPNPHETFSLMLLERVELLEKENDILKKYIEEFKQNFGYYQRYHCFKFETFFKCQYSYEIRSKIHTILNKIMAKRSLFNPLFAVWGYDVNDMYDIYTENSQYNIPTERYYIRFTMYIRNETPYSIANMETFINDASIYINYLSGGLYQLKFIIKEWISYQVILPYLNENNRIEVWMKGGHLFEHILNPNMTEDDFITSNNYVESEILQEEYFKMIQIGHWNELFKIVESI